MNPPIRWVHSFNCKKYIENVSKVSSLLSNANTLLEGLPVTISKIVGFQKEEQEILLNKLSENSDLYLKEGPVLNDADIDVNSRNISVFWKHTDDTYKINGQSLNLIPQSSNNVCIMCINNYSINYIAKLLEISHINPKQINTYIIRDLYKTKLWIYMKSKKELKKINIDKRPKYQRKSLILLFFTILFNTLALLILTLIEKLGITSLPSFLIKWIIFNKNEEFTLCVVDNKGESWVNIFLLKDSILSNLVEIAKEPNWKYVKNEIITHPVNWDLELVECKDSYHSYVTTWIREIYNGIKIGNVRVFKIESVKFMLLLNFKSFFTLVSSEKGELKLFNIYKLQKSILEGKLWNILNLYLINNELYSFILDYLKKQAIKDYNLTKNDIIEPEMFSLYQDKINNITFQAIFNILSNEWYDIKWFISFKFDTVFLDEHSIILMKNLKENINPNYLLKTLINNMFNMEMIGIYNYKSLSRYNIFEHDKLSEFLINIFFSRLDKKINDLKFNFFDRYYNSLWLKFWDLKLKDHNSDNQILAHDIITKTKFNFKYIRYLDTFIIGMNGTKLEVNDIRDSINFFLKSELQLHNLHSYIIDIHNDNLKFMNVNISSGLNYDNKYKIIFLFPKQLIIKALIYSGIISSKNRPICKKSLLKYNLNIIINTYIDINYFVLSSFAFCHDLPNLKRLLSYFINCSLKLTLQAKLDNKLWNRIIAPITPLRKKSKAFGINNSWKFIWLKSRGFTKKKQGQSNLNIFLLFRLGLISSKILKKIYYFRINNKKYLKRKYLIKNHYSNIININWENGVNFDFLISNFYDSSTSYTKKEKSNVSCGNQTNF